MIMVSFMATLSIFAMALFILNLVVNLLHVVLCLLVGSLHEPQPMAN